jgi:hypothetical protein
MLSILFSPKIKTEYPLIIGFFSIIQELFQGIYLQSFGLRGWFVLTIRLTNSLSHYTNDVIE